jgi:hypothetical protein
VSREADPGRLELGLRPPSSPAELLLGDGAHLELRREPSVHYELTPTAIGKSTAMRSHREISQPFTRLKRALMRRPA